MRTRLALPAAIIAVGLVLGACSSSDHDGMVAGTGPMGSMGTARGPGSTIAIDIPDGAGFSAADVAFAQGMIPHHAQAMQMADRALEVSSNPEVEELAEQIKAAQGPEIEQMTAWLTDWGQGVPDPVGDEDDGMGHGGTMTSPGMMSADDMGRLGAATGGDVDRMFLEMMILHHEGAIAMARQELADGMYRPTKDLAEAVIAAQQAEIETMNALLARLSS